MFESLIISKCKRKLRKMYEIERALTKKYDDAVEYGDTSFDFDSINEQMNKISNSISSFIENEYAEAVYKKYNAEKPMLVRVYTGEMISWEDAFGRDFNKISPSLRHSLVGLVETPGKYRFKDKNIQ